MAIPPHPTSLGGILTDEIRRGGPMPFAAFMERCLYDPAHGYYAGSPWERNPVGRAGDFFTAVSVGPVLGELLADHAAAAWASLGCPAAFHVIEQGANRGDLIADIFRALARNHPAFAHLARAVVVEPIDHLRAAQEAHLRASAIPVRWVRDLTDLADAPVSGCLYCNELLDSFPVERLRFDGTVWRRLGVGVEAAGGFEWVALEGPWPPDLEAAVQRIGSSFPAGYTTEFCRLLVPWVRGAAAALDHGRVVVLDYAREAADYFAPHRMDGTLRGYSGHRRCDDPFAAPGATDLTADVNATELCAAAANAGFQPGPLERQERFLTRLAERRLREMEASARPPTADQSTWLRQFCTLVHPSLLGRAFSVIELVRNPAAATAPTPSE